MIITKDKPLTVVYLPTSKGKYTAYFNELGIESQGNTLIEAMENLTNALKELMISSTENNVLNIPEIEEPLTPYFKKVIAQKSKTTIQKFLEDEEQFILE